MAIVADLSGNNPIAQKLCSPNRTFANLAAVVAATPLYSGEIVLALDTLIKYRGLELVAGRWGQTFSEVP
jgi:hypothetical protein